MGIVHESVPFHFCKSIVQYEKLLFISGCHTLRNGKMIRVGFLKFVLHLYFMLLHSLEIVLGEKGKIDEDRKNKRKSNSRVYV